MNWLWFYSLKGDIVLSKLNGQCPEKVAAYVVGKDQDAELTGQVVNSFIKLKCIE